MPLASKTSVNYSAGMEKRHCGPTNKWLDGTNPRKYCKHFYVRRVPYEQHACHKVAGAIGASDWCKLFEPKA